MDESMVLHRSGPDLCASPPSSCVLRHVLSNTLGRWGHVGFSWCPIRRADLASIFMVEQGVEDANALVDISAKWQIIFHLAANHSTFIDDHHATTGEVAVFEEHIIC